MELVRKVLSVLPLDVSKNLIYYLIILFLSIWFLYPVVQSLFKKEKPQGERTERFLHSQSYGESVQHGAKTREEENSKKASKGHSTTTFLPKRSPEPSEIDEDEVTTCFHLLPDVVLFHIFAFCDGEDVVQVEACSKVLKNIRLNVPGFPKLFPAVWRILYQRRYSTKKNIIFGALEQVSSSPNRSPGTTPMDYKYLYILRKKCLTDMRDFAVRCAPIVEALKKAHHVAGVRDPNIEPQAPVIEAWHEDLVQSLQGLLRNEEALMPFLHNSIKNLAFAYPIPILQMDDMVIGVEHCLVNCTPVFTLKTAPFCLICKTTNPQHHGELLGQRRGTCQMYYIPKMNADWHFMCAQLITTAWSQDSRDSVEGLLFSPKLLFDVHWDVRGVRRSNFEELQRFVQPDGGLQSEFDPTRLKFEVCRYEHDLLIAVAKSLRLLRDDLDKSNEVENSIRLLLRLFNQFLEVNTSMSFVFWGNARASQ